MDTLLEQVRTVAEGQIDFEGQRLVEFLSNVMLCVTGFIAFAAGYLTGDISLLLWTGLGGAALTFLVTIPPWPTYNKHAVRWLPPLKGRGAYNVTVDGQKIQ